VKCVDSDQSSTIGSNNSNENFDTIVFIEFYPDFEWFVGFSQSKSIFEYHSIVLIVHKTNQTPFFIMFSQKKLSLNICMTFVETSPVFSNLSLQVITTLKDGSS